jgi:hypothetical protein
MRHAVFPLAVAVLLGPCTGRVEPPAGLMVESYSESGGRMP